MRFGLFVPFHRLDPHEPIEQVYADALEQVVFAEDHGFDTAWFPEHHLSNYLATPNPLTACTWAAQHTKRIRLGTGVIILPYYHPLHLAEEIGMVDAMTHGRLEVGFGRGGYHYEYARFMQMSETEASERSLECAQAIMRVWGDEDADFSGKYWSFPPTSSTPKTVQRPHPPMWMATRNPASFRWAIENGFGMLFTPQREPVSSVIKFVEMVRREEQAVGTMGRTPIAISRMGLVTEDHQEAVKATESAWISHCLNKHLHNGTARVWQGHVEFDPLPPEDTLSTEQLLDNLMVGDPDTCIRKLREYEAAGVDQFIFYADLGNEQEKVMRSLNLFAKHVMPAFTEAPAGVTT